MARPRRRRRSSSMVVPREILPGVCSWRGSFFALVAHLSPQGVQLCPTNRIGRYDQRLDFFHLLSSSLQPLTPAFFFDPTHRDGSRPGSGDRPASPESPEGVVGNDGSHKNRFLWFGQTSSCLSYPDTAARLWPFDRMCADGDGLLEQTLGRPGSNNRTRLEPDLSDPFSSSFVLWPCFILHQHREGRLPYNEANK